MGLDYTVYVGFGVMIDKAKLKSGQERVPLFDHDFPDDFEYDYDPNTGQKLFKYYDKYIDEYDMEDWPFEVSGYPVVDADSDHPVIFVKYVEIDAKCGECDTLSEPTCEEVISFKEEMIRLGMYTDYGIHVITVVE